MIEFEKYLIEQGFSCYWYRYVNGEQIFIEGYNTPSSLGNIYNEYRKGDFKILIGLNEKDSPITLISPRNGLGDEVTVVGDNKFVTESDKEMNRKLKEMSNEEILSHISKLYPNV